MAENKFDFGVADRLAQTIATAASSLEVKQGEMETKFDKLREGFSDSGYDKYAADMKSADEALKDVITQMRVVAKHIKAYAEELKKTV